MLVYPDPFQLRDAYRRPSYGALRCEGHCGALAGTHESRASGSAKAPAQDLTVQPEVVKRAGLGVDIS